MIFGADCKHATHSKNVIKVVEVMMDVGVFEKD